jgi:3-hydroxyacyl-[acyl-carrier-protein] dehydratase
VIGTADIVKRIPHRYPIMVLDRVIEVNPGENLVGLKAITANEPCYQRAIGQPPLDDYRYPPSLLLESWAQAAVVLATWDEPNPDVLTGKVELAALAKGVEFEGRVYPGDLVEHRVSLVRQLGPTSIVEGISVVGSSVVLRVGHFVLAMREMADVLAARRQPETV